MKLILISDSGRESLSINTRHWVVRIAIAAAIAAVVFIGAISTHVLQDSTQKRQFKDLQRELLSGREGDRQLIDETRQQVEQELAALTVKAATLQARIMRLDALGERVVQIADLDKGEFDFSRDPALGGPIQNPAQGSETGAKETTSLAAGRVYQLLDELDALVEDRGHQLSVLDRQIMALELRSESYVRGRPVKWGWLSSGYGYRTDPFNGAQAWHSGVDFAGKEGGDVIAVAGGVVTASGERYGYGNMVEISHGDGIVTRYAHNEKNLVAIGDVVKKGEAIALMGSTGRSTGPHVHFEVLRHGKTIDPERFIYRASL